MKYNLSLPSEYEKATRLLARLATAKALVEVRKISPVRTLNQNAYLHLLLGAFAEHFGLSRREAKQQYKAVNADLYYYRKGGFMFVKSSADLSVADMTKSIDRLRELSAAMDFPLPTATDQGWLRSLENDIEAAEPYL